MKPKNVKLSKKDVETLREIKTIKENKTNKPKNSLKSFMKRLTA